MSFFFSSESATTEDDAVREVPAAPTNTATTSDGEGSDAEDNAAAAETVEADQDKRRKFSPDGGDAVYGIVFLLKKLRSECDEGLTHLQMRKYTPNAANGVARGVVKVVEETIKLLVTAADALKFVRKSFQDLPIDMAEQEKLQEEDKQNQTRGSRRGGSDDDGDVLLKLALLKALMGGR